MIYKNFEYEIIDNKVTITKYTGVETDVVIPSEIDGLKVTCIGNYAFCSCSSLTSVSIPNSVTTIKGSAFYRCNSLTRVIMSDSVTSIMGYTFAWCSSLKNITISNDVTMIGGFTFTGCGFLTSKANNYKAFNITNNKLICMNNCEFKENEWTDNTDNPKLRKRGYHYCTNLFEIFDAYCGVIDEDIVIYECEVGDTVIKSNTSLCVTNKIKPVKRLHREDVIRILNNTN